MSRTKYVLGVLGVLMLPPTILRRVRMSDLPDMGLSGGVGALVGAVLTWAGFKSRLDSQDARIKALEEGAVTEATCTERAKGCYTQFTDIKDMLREIRDDVKELAKLI